jgi:hypothetical protein
MEIQMVRELACDTCLTARMVCRTHDALWTRERRETWLMTIALIDTEVPGLKL